MTYLILAALTASARHWLGRIWTWLRSRTPLAGNTGRHTEQALDWDWADRIDEPGSDLEFAAPLPPLQQWSSNPRLRPWQMQAWAAVAPSVARGVWQPRLDDTAWDKGQAKWLRDFLACPQEFLPQLLAADKAAMAGAS